MIFTVHLPHFEHVPYFEHHLYKQRIFQVYNKLINLVHEDLCRLVNEIKLQT